MDFYCLLTLSPSSMGVPHPRKHYTFLCQNYFPKNNGLLIIFLPHSETVNIFHCALGEIKSRYPEVAFVAFQDLASNSFSCRFLVFNSLYTKPFWLPCWGLSIACIIPTFLVWILTGSMWHPQTGLFGECLIK